MFLIRVIKTAKNNTVTNLVQTKIFLKRYKPSCFKWNILHFSDFWILRINSNCCIWSFSIIVICCRGILSFCEKWHVHTFFQNEVTLRLLKIEKSLFSFLKVLLMYNLVLLLNLAKYLRAIQNCLVNTYSKFQTKVS